jgi:microtubule-associated protein-like 6
VYGYNGHSAKQNIYYSAKGELVYPAGALCVVQDLANKTQAFFAGHTDLVLSLKVFREDQLINVEDNKNRCLVASGECGVRPSICVWDCETRMLLSCMKGFHRNGVQMLDFSPDGTKLASLGCDTYNSIAVYIWETGEKIWATRTTFEKVHDIRYLANDVIASCGKDHVFLWKEQKNYLQKFLWN